MRPQGANSGSFGQKKPALARRGGSPVTLVPGIRRRRIPVPGILLPSDPGVLYLWSFLIGFREHTGIHGNTREYQEYREYPGIPGNTGNTREYREYPEYREYREYTEYSNKARRAVGLCITVIRPVGPLASVILRIRPVGPLASMLLKIRP